MQYTFPLRKSSTTPLRNPQQLQLTCTNFHPAKRERKRKESKLTINLTAFIITQPNPTVSSHYDEDTKSKLAFLTRFHDVDDTSHQYTTAKVADMSATESCYTSSNNNDYKY